MDEPPIVLTAPIRFAGAKAKEFGDQLRSSLDRGQVVIADLTTTWVCDLNAVGELRMVSDLATGAERELRIVVASTSIMHQFALAGIDGQLRVYPSLALAMRH